MKQIDLKDRKILFELDQNSRQSLSQIGKKVGLAKSIVAYRIKRLTKLEIIRSYYTVVDLYKLGFIAPRFHFVFQYITPEVQKEILNYFINSKYTFIVVSCYGPFDLSVLFGLRDIRQLYQLWQEIQSKFGYYFEKQSLAFYLNETHLQPLYLLNEKERKKTSSASVRNPICDTIVLDDIELKILNALSHNAQLSLTVLSKQLKLTSRQISYRIKKMVEMGVIEGFRTEIDISKLGYHSYKTYVFLKEFNIRSKIINYLYSNPNLVCIDTTTGESHLELEFHLENVDKLHAIMQDISEKFPNAIRNYQYASVKEINKWLYLPQLKDK